MVAVYDYVPPKVNDGFYRDSLEDSLALIDPTFIHSTKLLYRVQLKNKYTICATTANDNITLKGRYYKNCFRVTAAKQVLRLNIKRVHREPVS